MHCDVIHIDALSRCGGNGFESVGFQMNMAAKHVTYGIENLDSAHDWIEGHVCGVSS